jgi:hypothetical protein
MRTLIRKWSVIFALGCVGVSYCAASFAAPKGGDAGAHSLAGGVILGSPTGFTAKFWMDRQSAADFGLAFSFDSFVLVYSDYLWHLPQFDLEKGAPRFFRELTPYVGIGGVLFISTNSLKKSSRYFDSGGVGLGVRIPIGLEWRPVAPRLGIYLEIVPGVGVLPSTFGFAQGGIGARFYF